MHHCVSMLHTARMHMEPGCFRAVGRAGGEELKENNLALWLTPAICIHRSPLCGRNFEYYSEDPFVTGKLAGAWYAESSQTMSVPQSSTLP